MSVAEGFCSIRCSSKVMQKKVEEYPGGRGRLASNGLMPVDKPDTITLLSGPSRSSCRTTYRRWVTDSLVFADQAPPDVNKPLGKNQPRRQDFQGQSSILCAL